MSIDGITPDEWNSVSKPKHYNTGAIETIDAIKASMSDLEFQGYLKGSALKYLWRFDKKQKPLEDLSKCSWFLDRLVKEKVNEGN